jgi:methionyl-tRNA formyltransferase
MQRAPCETKEWAQAHDLPVLTPETIDAAFMETLAGYGCAYAIVVAYGKILPQKLIDSFPKGVLNIHYSLLPKYRGASPVEAALLHGDAVTGVSIQQMVYKLDAGDVLAQQEVAIEPTETTRELRPRLVATGAELLADVLPAFERGELSSTAQDESQATYTKKIEKAEGELDLTGDSRANWNKYRAYAESPGTYFFAEKNGKRLRVKIVSAALEGGRFMPLRVIPEGKKEMSYADFVR